MTQRIIFIGDSITEWGVREDTEGIGTGYVRILHDYLKTTYPEEDLDIINKGIGGNRIIDLAERWQCDVIDLNPDIVSISIGINDVWRQFDQPNIEQVYPDKFRNVYEYLLKQVHEKTNAQIIVMEPTIIEENVDSIGNKKLEPYVEITNCLAKKYNLVVVPTHQAFLKYLEAGNGYELTTDGVHMNSYGNMLMAVNWLKASRAILSNLID
ncbi:SGNH/GDSL hydrolase family protein [Virgibacillus sp. FSP13]